MLKKEEQKSRPWSERKLLSVLLEFEINFRTAAAAAAKATKSSSKSDAKLCCSLPRLSLSAVVGSDFGVAKWPNCDKFAKRL